MSVKALRAFYAAQIEDAKAKGLLLSLHLKATMMKVSDPIMFGHAVSVFYKDALDKHAATLKEIGFNPNNGLGDLYAKIKTLPEAKRAEIEADIKAVYDKRPALAMVDSDNGHHQPPRPQRHHRRRLHAGRRPRVGPDVGPGREAPRDQGHDPRPLLRHDLQDDHRGLPGSTAPSTRPPWAASPTSGSWPRRPRSTAPTRRPSRSRSPGRSGSSRPTAGRSWSTRSRPATSGACPGSKDIPIQDWVKLAVRRAKATGAHGVFWLDRNRAHDTQVIAKVEKYLKDHDTTGLEIKILAPVEAMKYSLERIRKGLDTISVTGNVLRDYLTDLFPILEIGTSAKMLSIVPLLAGGGLFETGAGGSAPKHVQQFEKEDYLRWDSLGEFSAFAASLEHLAGAFKNAKAQVLAETLDPAIAKFLDNNKSPARKVGQIDNRGSHFYLALYWAEALAAQDKDKELQGAVRRRGQGARREGGRDRRRADRGPGQARRHGRLLPPGQGQARGGHAAQRDANAIIDAL